MFETSPLNPDSFITSNKTFAAYERQQQLLNPSRVHEGFLIKTGPIPQGHIKVIDFADIPFDFRLMSIWLWMPAATDEDGLSVAIVHEGVEEMVFDLRRNSSPWQPPFHILNAEYRLRVLPDSDVSALWFYLQAAKLLDVEEV